MKLEDLLNCSAAKLKAMSDKELEEYVKQFYTVTRPELAKKPEGSTSAIKRTASQPNAKQAKYDQLMKMAGNLGIELDL